MAELGGRLPNRLFVVVGTRPEAIKLAPVVQALAARGLPPAIVFTGQHPGLHLAMKGVQRAARILLDCPGQDDPHAHVGEVAWAVRPLVGGADLVIVQGDTSSALGGALGAATAGVPVAHVEAGLRSHDLRRPWPEEEFRVAIDRDSALLFAPTELSAANLRRERVRGRIHVTGNSGIDALLDVRRDAEVPKQRGRRPRLLVTCHRRENWHGGLEGVAGALRLIAAETVAQVDVLLHPNPELARTVGQLLGGVAGISFRSPCGHAETVAAMLASDLILSDSGGLQEEAAVLGVPLLILRDRTERPEAIACGALELVGTSTDRIVQAVRRRLGSSAPAGPSLPFGDGRAAARIAAIVEEWLDQRGLAAPAPTAAATGAGW